jgi:hypothetical protein
MFNGGVSSRRASIYRAGVRGLARSIDLVCVPVWLMASRGHTGSGRSKEHLGVTVRVSGTSTAIQAPLRGAIRHLAPRRLAECTTSGVDRAVPAKRYSYWDYQ